MKNLISLISIFIFSLLLLAGAYFIPWRTVDWGRVSVAPAQTITVTGYAEKTEKNQVASFTAGVTAFSDDKDEASQEVNQKVRAVIDVVKNFGIEDGNIQTQNLSISKQEMPDAEYDWRVSNNIEISKVDADQADELADLLAETEATNVYGPNFSLETARESSAELLGEAIDNARSKAEKMAAASNRQVGEVISVTEGASSQPGIVRLEGLGGGGAPVEPGTSPVSQTVTVVFALK